MVDVLPPHTPYPRWEVTGTATEGYITINVMQSGNIDVKQEYKLGDNTLLKTLQAISTYVKQEPSSDPDSMETSMSTQHTAPPPAATATTSAASTAPSATGEIPSKQGFLDGSVKTLEHVMCQVRIKLSKAKESTPSTPSQKVTENLLPAKLDLVTPTPETLQGLELQQRKETLLETENSQVMILPSEDLQKMLNGQTGLMPGADSRVRVERLHSTSAGTASFVMECDAHESVVTTKPFLNVLKSPKKVKSPAQSPGKQRSVKRAVKSPAKRTAWRQSKMPKIVLNTANTMKAFAVQGFPTKRVLEGVMLEDIAKIAKIKDQIDDVSSSGEAIFQLTEEVDSKPPPVVLSRSGRRIKPKHFSADFETFETANVFGIKKEPECDSMDDSMDLSVGEADSSEDQVTKKKSSRYSDAVLCPLCGKQCSAKGYLALHMRSMHQEDGVKCTMCRDVFASEYDCDAHMMETHINPPEKTKKNRHYAEVPRVKCGLCDASYIINHRYKLYDHISTHHPEEAKCCDKGLCKYACFTEEELQEHVLKRHRNFKCLICSEKFGKKEELVTHMEEHGKRDERKCNVCNEVIKGPLKMFKDHKAAHKVHICEICKDNFSSRDELYIHLIEVHATNKTFGIENSDNTGSGNQDVQLDVEPAVETTPQLFGCSICNQSFANMSELKDHVLEHKQEQGNMCDICGEVIEGGRKLFREHRKTHRPTTLTCEECEEHFPTLQAMNRHLKETHDLMPYKCKLCDESFLDYRPLKMHMIRNHGLQSEHICEICGKGYPFKNLLTRHMFTHTVDKPFLCTHCGAEFRTKCSLDRHLDVKHTATPKYSCPFCDEAFVIKHKLEKHLGTKHKEHLKFPCDKCAKSFQYGYQLKRHMHMHGDEGGRGKCVCNQCGKGFISLNFLRQHQKMHCQSQTFPCDHCSKVYKSAVSLRTHMLSHTGTPTHGCHLCEKKFYTTDSLRSHMKSHAERNFVCDICGKGFKALDKLKNHKAIHTGIKRFVCNICGKAFTHHGGLWNHRRDVHKVDAHGTPTPTVRVRPKRVRKPQIKIPTQEEISDEDSSSDEYDSTEMETENFESVIPQAETFAQSRQGVITEEMQFVIPEGLQLVAGEEIVMAEPDN